MAETNESLNEPGPITAALVARLESEGSLSPEEAITAIVFAIAELEVLIREPPEHKRPSPMPAPE